MVALTSRASSQKGLVEDTGMRSTFLVVGATPREPTWIIVLAIAATA